MSFLAKVEGFFHKAQQDVATEFDKIFGKEAGAAFSSGAKALLHTAEGQLAVQVVEALSGVAGANLSSADKRSSAFSQLESSFKSQGKTVANGLINLLIEVAVAAVQQKFAA